MTKRHSEVYETPFGEFGIDKFSDGYHTARGFEVLDTTATLAEARALVAAILTAAAFDAVQVHRRQLCEAQATLENACNLQLFRVQP